MSKYARAHVCSFERERGLRSSNSMGKGAVPPHFLNLNMHFKYYHLPPSRGHGLSISWTIEYTQSIKARSIS